MKALFWISLAGIVYTYVGYPLVMFLLARFFSRPWKRADTAASVSIVMAVHNGAQRIQAQVEHLLWLEPELVREVIIVSDGSNDGTAEMLNDLQRSRLQTIILPEQVGKAAALNHAIAHATGEILLFIDIRPKVVPGALQKLLSNFADPSVGCVAGELILNTDGHDAAASAVSGVYWKYEQWIRNCEAAWDSPVGVYGGFYAARRSLVQPFPEGIILDDMFQPLSILRKGYRSVLDRSAIVIDTWPGKVSGEFQRKVRTLAGNYQLFSLAPWTLSSHNRVLFQLISHKLMRLVVPYLFLCMLLTATVLGIHSLEWRVVAVAQWAFWLAAAVSLKTKLPLIHRLASAASALLVLNIAAVAGFYKFIFTSGPLWKIWSPGGQVPTTAIPLERGRESV
ncbi:glycosyltransferase family 2 protein [Edaphobacter modestus]|uniref:Cellulose synthase/poly-beta-1,6-N-acetylglucosamine synthase-like glycosyltransferase n=1 Tax=Edaphobacter modestus TaxID=388466 RepID=A0A4Q7YXJ6_9BACT|nr:glycosyltransferase family 2 protein [Edaphobacter modestus]RZU42458.1 cellulose synthase/poly-beta-1,6-N-acetylglucosamine synthase-like glycosyltransferase [Edaphobacter modestus]